MRYSQDLLTRQWYRVGDKVAREKAGQALRDAIKTRRAMERKRVLNDSLDEKSNYYDPLCISEEQANHTFHSPINIENVSFSEHHDDGNSSMACHVKRPNHAYEMITQSQDAVVRPPSHVHSNEGVVSFHASKMDQNILGFSGEVGRPHCTEFVTPDSLRSKLALNRHRGDQSFVASLLPSKHFESEYLSGELEPRPISSVRRPFIDDSMKTQLPFGGGGGRANLLEQPTSDRIGSMMVYTKNQKASIIVGESVTLIGDDQTPQVLPQQTRSTDESALHSMLTHLLQPETGNDISPYFRNFFVSSTNHWHSSHLDEFGFCCDIVGSEKATLQQLSDLANIEEESSCVGSGAIMTETSTFNMMGHSNTHSTVRFSDKTSQDHVLLDKYSQAPQALLQGPEPQFLPSTFGSDQFLTMGRGGGNVESKSGYSRNCYPDITKSNIPLLAASTLPRDTNECDKFI